MGMTKMQRLKREAAARSYFSGKKIGAEGDAFSMYAPEAQSNVIDQLPGIEEGDAEIVLTVTNSNIATKKAIIFGGYLAEGKDNFGNDADIAVVAKGSTSYGEILAETKSGGIFIKGLRMVVTTTAQFTNAITKFEKSSGGKTVSEDFFPDTQGDEYRQDTKRVTVGGFELVATGGARLEFDVLPSEVVTLIFKIRTRIEQKNFFEGRPVLAIKR